VTTLAFMPGHWEWLIIGVVMLLLFGSRLPSVARSIGDALREFKKGVHEINDDVKTPPHHQQQSYSAAKPPLTSGGTDERVSHGAQAGNEHEAVESKPE
jgi:sec-independent protein translocase protein TatA